MMLLLFHVVISYVVVTQTWVTSSPTHLLCPQQTFFLLGRLQHLISVVFTKYQKNDLKQSQWAHVTKLLILLFVVCCIYYVCASFISLHVTIMYLPNNITKAQLNTWFVLYKPLHIKIYHIMYHFKNVVFYPGLLSACTNQWDLDLTS